MKYIYYEYLTFSLHRRQLDVFGAFPLIPRAALAAEAGAAAECEEEQSGGRSDVRKENACDYAAPLTGREAPAVKEIVSPQTAAEKTADGMTTAPYKNANCGKISSCSPVRI